MIEKTVNGLRIMSGIEQLLEPDLGLAGPAVQRHHHEALARLEPQTNVQLRT
jgi:hypothetical protein